VADGGSDRVDDDEIATVLLVAYAGEGNARDRTRSHDARLEEAERLPSREVEPAPRAGPALDILDAAGGACASPITGSATYARPGTSS
jgi:hypothetical protein